MQSRSLERELSLLVLGQIPEGSSNDIKKENLEVFLFKALDTLKQYWKEGLDNCATNLEFAQQELLDSELQDADKNSIAKVREHLKAGILSSEQVLNSLAATLEFPRLLILADQELIRNGVKERVDLVMKESIRIDEKLDNVMEGWRLKRLPRIDRDILRLAFVDLVILHTPAAVTCNEAVELANRYSDEQGRRMINGVLRRLQHFILTTEKS